MAYGARESWLGRQDLLGGGKAQQAARLDPEDEGAIRHLIDAKGLYESAAQHSAKGAIAAGVASALALGLTYSYYRGLVDLRGGYTTVRLTHIPEGLSLFHNGEACEVNNGSALLQTWSDSPQIVDLRRGDEVVPISSLGSLILLFPLGQHLNVRVDHLIERYRSVAQKSQS